MRTDDNDFGEPRVPAMTREAITEFFARQKEAWDARDPEALSRGHAEDATIVSPIFRTVTGRRAILESYRSLFTIFPDWRFQTDALVVDGARAVQVFTIQATHVGEFMGIAGSGRTCEIQGVCIFEMGDGVIAHERRIYDFTGFLIQLGVLRSKPARP